MATYEYALEFGFNLGQASPTKTAGMMWGMGVRKKEDSEWSNWEHYDPREPIVDASQVRIYLVNIGSPIVPLEVQVAPDSEIDSAKAFDARAGQTVTAPWSEVPVLAAGVVEGDYDCSGLVLTGVPHIRLGEFIATCQAGLQDSRFLITMKVTLESGGIRYHFSQDPELVVGGDSGALKELAARAVTAS